MTDLKFDGVIKPVRRGGWSARGVTAAVRHGQLFETQIGPREFAGVDSAAEWLRAMAAERAIETVEIVVRDEAR